YSNLRAAYQEQGDAEALETARALLQEQQNITLGDKERLFGYLEGGGKVILPEPQALLTPASKMPGLDGQKRSKSYGNTITLGDKERRFGCGEGGGTVLLPEPQGLLTPASKMPGLHGQRRSKTYGNPITLRDTTDEVSEKVRRRPTDPARLRRTDRGDPDKCPVYQLHLVYTDQATHDWVNQGCRSAGIGWLDCKKPVIDAICAELGPIQQRAVEYEGNPDAVRLILNEGAERARDAARDTLNEVRQAMGLSYRRGW